MRIAWKRGEGDSREKEGQRKVLELGLGSRKSSTQDILSCGRDTVDVRR